MNFFFYRIFEWNDQGDPLKIIYLGFTKGFVKVPHKRLKQIGGFWDSEEWLKMDSKVARGLGSSEFSQRDIYWVEQRLDLEVVYHKSLF